jgi:hypothetical protein
MNAPWAHESERRMADHLDSVHCGGDLRAVPDFRLSRAFAIKLAICAMVAQSLAIAAGLNDAASRGRPF